MSIRTYSFRFILCCFLGLGSLSVPHLSAQRTQYYTDTERSLKDGIDLFQKQKYGAAQSRFYDFLQSGNAMTEYARSEASYYYAACAVELFHDNAEYLMKHFIEEFPESPKVVQAHFQLGKLYFRKKDYPAAIRELKASDVFLLSKTEYFEYYYKLGYSQFMTDDLDGALKSFAEVKDRKNLYQMPATYYSGHICYVQKKYENALQHFLLLREDKNFSKIVPLYIAQIYFIQHKYQEAVTYAEPIADTLKGKNTGIIRRMLAESYYELKEYTKATANYETYLAGGNELDRNGSYRLGLCYYRQGSYPQARPYLEVAGAPDDSLGQSASYYLSDCLIREGEKTQALDALKRSFTLDFNKRISKEALFNFAKLSYELGYNPYNEAVDALQTYIDRYPSATNLDDAYELLVNIYMSLHNYRDALVSLGKIKVKNTGLKIAEQRIYLFRGMELFNTLDYTNAIQHFEKVIEKNYDHKLSAEAKFWMADAHYRMDDYEGAVRLFDNFLVSPSVSSLPYHRDAHYNLGYAHFKLKNYSTALSEFRTYTEGMVQDQRKLNDAYQRLGDCYFMARNYDKAIENYDKAINLNKVMNDYAYMQKALLQGLSGNQAGKAATLEKAVSLYPTSSYLEEMRYELGRAHLSLGKFNEAIRDFEGIANATQPGKYLVKAYLQLGAIYANSDNYREALGYYKRVTDEFPGTREAQEAIRNIKNIYVEMGDMDALAQYTQGNQGELDSASFRAAENLYNTGNCDKSTDALGKYIQNFPNGAFIVDAHHMRAECFFKLERYDQSVDDYEYLISQRDAMYKDGALNRLSWIYERRKDSVNLVRIYSAILESPANTAVLQNAETGLMRNYYKLGRYEEAMTHAKAVQKFDKLDAATDEQANYIIASSLLQLQRPDEALVYFKKLHAKNSSPYYPEASFRIGDILYNRGDYKEAEKLLRGSVKYMGGQKNWLARSFILLSDIYLELKDYSNAKAVLQTVIDKHDGQDLVDLARQKLDAIIAMEEGGPKNMQQEPTEFDLQQNKPKKKGTTNENNIQN